MALNLRHEITALLLRDFGLKKKIRTVEILVKMYDIDPADKQTLAKTVRVGNIFKPIPLTTCTRPVCLYHSGV